MAAYLTAVSASGSRTMIGVQVDASFFENRLFFGRLTPLLPRHRATLAYCPEQAAVKCLAFLVRCVAGLGK